MINTVTSGVKRAGGPVKIVSAVVLVVALSVGAQIPDVGTSKDPGAVVQPVGGPTGAMGGAGAAPTGATGPTGPEDLEVEGEAARTVAFNNVQPQRAGPTGPSGPTGITGALPLAVNPPAGADGRLRITYSAANDGKRQRVGREAAALSDEHAVVFAATAGAGDTPEFRVTAGEPVTIPLRLALPATTNVDRADGSLRIEFIEGKEKDPAAVGAVAVTGAVPSVRVIPETSKLRVTRGLGPFSVVDTSAWLLRDDAGVQVVGPGVEAFKARGPRRVRLSTERNGELLGTLHFPERKGLSPNYAEIKIDDVNLTGKYAGGVPLDPGGSSAAAVPLEVEVQDHFLWPFAVLLVSALLGGFLIAYWNLVRRREILRKALKDAQARYANAGGDHLEWMFALSPTLGLREPKWPTKDQGAPDGGWLKADQLHLDIGKATDPAAFAECGKGVGEIVAEVERWRRLRRSGGVLKAEIDAFGLKNDDQAREDAQDVLDLLAERGPDPGAPTEARIRALEDERLVLGLYARLTEQWARLPAGHALKETHKPAKQYEKLADRETKANGTADLQKKLALALHDVQRAADRLLGGGAGLAGVEAFGTPTTTAREPAAARFADQTDPSEPDTRTGAQILEGVQAVDWWIAGATAIVTAAACLLPLYVENHTFGSWEDYLTLVFLGFLGAAAGKALVIDWNAFPPLMPYTVDAATTFEPAQPPDDGGNGGDGDQDDSASGTEEEKAEEAAPAGDPAKKDEEAAPAGDPAKKDEEGGGEPPQTS